MLTMLRITEAIDDIKTATLRLDGRLGNDDLSELLALIAQHQKVPDRHTIVDMTGVPFMSDEAAAQLTRLASDRIRFVHCSPYIETLLQSHLTIS